MGVFGSWLVGLGLALLLRTKIPAGGTFKVLLLLPWVVPIVVSSTAWNWLVATPDSLIPSLFRNLGLGTPLFLADPTLAAITVMVFKVWVSFPFMMMMISAALASVDTTVYEAASMDGATRFQQFSQITLPLIARSTYISWILMTIFCVNDFPTIYLLTGGGPVDATTSLVVLAYRTVFQDFATGPGVAIAFLMTMTLVVISVHPVPPDPKVERRIMSAVVHAHPESGPVLGVAGPAKNTRVLSEAGMRGRWWRFTAILPSPRSSWSRSWSPWSWPSPPDRTAPPPA